ncbi:oligopeptidase A [Litoribrevibacter albus]|uniref:oligopeptidase A n=1 Tax=Litoribrevibacter albus TaxID=1473156 RepID=A0AA37SDI3_9GAMM|nr:oligopeptidase A [Litoribrevibacter albus]GLQ32945.1 oligopeptidase A [Litoribrevibacter albus]
MSNPTNPLLQNPELPQFSEIKPAHVQPAIQQLIETNEKNIDDLLQQLADVTWDSLIATSDEWDDVLSKAWSPVSHMNSVVNSDELRDAYNACLPLLSEYSTKLGQNQTLFQAYKALSESEQFASLDTAQKQVVSNALRDFHLSGVDLPEEKKQRFSELKKQLSELTSKFSENVLDATHAWSKLISDVSELAGVPESALGLMKQQAEQAGEEGYRLTLDIPVYLPVMTYCENQALRKEMYTAYATKASDQGPNAGEYDNTSIMYDVLKCRKELAQLLGFNSYAERSLATKMAENTDQVVEFLFDLAEKSKPVAEKELEELKTFAKENFGVEEMNPWDVGFYGEKLKHARYEISQEQLRPYFPFPKVVSGMFELVQRLYGITVVEITEFDRWHDQVHFYEIQKEGEAIARFYLDPYARAKKRGGAWMDECRVRRLRQDGSLQLPVAYLVCNFTPPVGDQPALLTHDEVTTLFHEFGHGLHHMLTQINYSAVSGINGVAWDAVELPSQFMENFCWEEEVLDFISGHFETGEPLPKSLLEKMLAAKNFQSGMQMVRQLEFSLFDFILHRDFDENTDILNILNEVREKVAVIVPPEWHRFPHSFSHIFAGGYAAGYYSYKWAEVLSADAFSRFEEEGLFNAEVGHSFLNNILEKGGSSEPMALFVAFRGRKPTVDALLRHSGITA